MIILLPPSDNFPSISDHIIWVKGSLSLLIYSLLPLFYTFVFAVSFWFMFYLDTFSLILFSFGFTVLFKIRIYNTFTYVSLFRQPFGYIFTFVLVLLFLFLSLFIYISTDIISTSSSHTPPMYLQIHDPPHLYLDLPSHFLLHLHLLHIFLYATLNIHLLFSLHIHLRSPYSPLSIPLILPIPITHLLYFPQYTSMASEFLLRKTGKKLQRCNSLVIGQDKIYGEMTRQMSWWNGKITATGIWRNLKR